MNGGGVSVNKIYFEKFCSESDFEYMTEILFNERIMTMSYGRIFTPEEAKKYYGRVINNNEKHKDIGTFKVLDNDTREFMGICGLTPIEGTSNVEIEYSLLPQFWGKGLGTEIVRKSVLNAQKVEGIDNIVATVDPENVPSKKVLLKNGFEFFSDYKLEDEDRVQKFRKGVNVITVLE